MRAGTDEGGTTGSRAFARPSLITSAEMNDADPLDPSRVRERDDAGRGGGAHADGIDITVGVVDDFEVVRAGLVHLLRSSDGISVVGSAPNGADAIALVEQTLPDVVVIDASTRSSGGVDVIRTIKRRHPACKVVVLTASTEQGRIREARDAGADGFVPEQAGRDEVVGAIRSVMVDGLEPDAAPAACDLPPSCVDELTARQLDVLALLALGRTNKQIAAELAIGDRTLKADLAQIYRRLGVSSRTQAAIWAVRNAPHG